MSDGITGFVSEQLLWGMCLIAVVGFEIIEVQWNKIISMGFLFQCMLVISVVSQASAIEVSHGHGKPTNIREF